MWGIFQKSSRYLRFKHKDNRWLPEREKKAHIENVREGEKEYDRQSWSLPVSWSLRTAKSTA